MEEQRYGQPLGAAREWPSIVTAAMKTHFFCFLTIFVLTLQAIADGSRTDNWGAVTNGAQMSIALKNGKRQIKAIQPVILAVCIRNVSTNNDFYLFQSNGVLGSPDLTFVVISPSGKEVPPRLIHEPDSGGFYTVRPGETLEFELNLSDLYRFDGAGTYKIKAEYWLRLLDGQKPFTPFTVISSPLSVSVVP